MLICKIVGKISGGEVGQIGLSSDTDRVADSEEKWEGNMVLMKDGKSKKCVGKMMEGIRKGKRKYEGRKQE